MRWKVSLCTAALMAAVLVTPAFALDYSVDGPSPGDFGTPTSNETVYVGTETTANVDRSKTAALVPPDFGTPTSYLPGSGEPLTPNLTGNNGGAVTVIDPSGGPVQVPGGVAAPNVAVTPSAIVPAIKYTDVTSDLYYSGGYLGTLKIPSLDVSVKVYQGTDSTQLAKGTGHFTSTSIWDGNVAVAGHNRGANCYFGSIHTLDVGDTIKLTTKMGTRTYAVTSVTKISETDSSMLAATVENCITLYTCVRGQSAYRWCVRAVEV